MFYKLDKKLTKIFGKISILSGIFMIIISFLATANVLTSKLFKWSIPAANDWVTYLFLAAVYCSIVYVRLDTGLIAVDLLSSHYPPVVKNILSIVADGCGIAIFGAISVTPSLYYSRISNTMPCPPLQTEHSRCGHLT